MFDPADTQTNYPSQSRYSSTHISLGTPDLTEEMHTSDRVEIEKLLDKLDVDEPNPIEDDRESYELEGTISLVHGYEENFKYDVTEGNITLARFNGVLEYGDQKVEIDETYRERATEVFDPLQDNSSLDLEAESSTGNQRAASD